MKRLAAISMTMALTLSVSGQRGGGRNGAIGGVRVQAGASRPVPSTVGTGLTHFAGAVPSARPGGYGNSDRRRGGFASDRYRPRYGGYGTSVPLIYPIWSGWNGWTDPTQSYDAAGYGDGAPRSDSSVYANDAQDNEQPSAPGPYLAPYWPAPTSQSSAPVERPAVVPEPEEAVTLVFRDGRPTQQIHNYALTRTRFMVLDGHPREIPLDQLDLKATEKVNRAAGVEFKVPYAR